MTDIKNLITESAMDGVNVGLNKSSAGAIIDHIDIWTSAIKKRNSQGRGSNSKVELTGVKKLRELILELAVRGKLVPQDPNDESPNASISESIKNRERLINEGVIKKSRSKKIIKDENFYPYPASWHRVKIEDLMQVLNGRAYKKHEMLSEGTPLLRVGNLFTSNEWYYSDLELEPEKYIDDGDLIYAWSASFGPFIWDGGRVIYHYHIWKMDVYSSNCLDKNFSRLFLSAISERIKASGNGIAMIHMTKERMEKVIHPVPPLAEQHRIVAKVDELMALCDQLEQQTEQSLTAHQTLVEELLKALTDSKYADDLTAMDGGNEGIAGANSFQASWQRIAEHFDILFTTEQSIEQLKQTILQLAVMGKLVPQNPNDEPVEELLSRIYSHREERVKNKEIQKFKTVKPIDEPNDDSPLSWKSILLNDLVFVTKLAGFEYTKHINLKDSGEVPVIRAQNVRPFKPDLRNLKYIDKETSMALPRSALDRAALLITFIGAGIGDVCLLNEEQRWHLAPNVAKVEAFSDLNLHYLSVYLNSPRGKVELFKSMKSTAQPSLSMTTLREIWVSLPPLAEQHRIVAKVDELMALCDQLKAHLSDAQTTQLHLADAVVENALNEPVVSQSCCRNGIYMFKIDTSSNRISRIASKSFSELGFSERNHLQEWLANEPDALGEELLIIQKEFDGFDDTRERLDLLALDKVGNLVVIENKLDDSGRDVLWQALKYASYCSSLTKQQIVDIYQAYLTRYCDATDAKSNLCDFFNIADLEELVLNSGNSQRLVFVAANYRKEVTSTALWLLSHNIQVQCFKVTPYAMQDDLFLNVEQIIPTPEAKEFMIGINAKEAEEHQTKTEISNRHKIRPEFWARLLDVLHRSECNLFNNISPNKDNWLAASSGASGCIYVLIFNKKQVRVELVLQSGNAERNKLFFDKLRAFEEVINGDFGQPLTWLRQDNVKQSKIVIVKECDAYEADNWPDLIEWLVSATTNFEKAFRNHLPLVSQQLKDF